MVSTVEYFRPQDPAEGVEYDAFLRMLPQLHTDHGGEFVAVSGGEVIASGVYYSQVSEEAKRAAGDRTVYCEWAEPSDGYTFFIGGFTVLTDDSAFDGPNQVAESH